MEAEAETFHFSSACLGNLEGESIEHIDGLEELLDQAGDMEKLLESKIYWEVPDMTMRQLGAIVEKTLPEAAKSA